MGKKFTEKTDGIDIHNKNEWQKYFSKDMEIK